MHSATDRFWSNFSQLPEFVQKTARKNFKLLKLDPLHPSLHFKKIGKFWSVRIGGTYRALAVKDDQNFTWVWIGGHAEYDRLIAGK